MQQFVEWLGKTQQHGPSSDWEKHSNTVHRLKARRWQWCMTLHWIRDLSQLGDNVTKEFFAGSGVGTGHGEGRGWGKVQTRMFSLWRNMTASASGVVPVESAFLSRLESNRMRRYGRVGSRCARSNSSDRRQIRIMRRIRAWRDTFVCGGAPLPSTCPSLQPTTTTTFTKHASNSWSVHDKNAAATAI